MSSYPIVISSENLIPNTDNSFLYSFPNTTDLSNYECSIGQGFLYYSWYNISASLNNNTFQLRVPTGASYNDYTIILPDGAYNVSTLNSYLQFWFIENDLYITNDTTGENLYYASFQLSSQSYQILFISTSIPTSTPTGYTNHGITWPTSSNQAIQLTVLSGNNFKDFLGFSPGTYPPSSTISGSIYTYGSDFTPNVNSINTIQIRLSCLYNKLSSNTQLLHVFNNKGANIGELIDISPNEYNFINCQGSPKDIILSFYTTEGKPLQLLDKNITITLLFREKNNK